MTTKQEIKRILRERATSIVDERIGPEILDAIAEWTSELMGKLTTLKAEDQKSVDEAFNAMVSEMFLRCSCSCLISS